MNFVPTPPLPPPPPPQGSFRTRKIFRLLEEDEEIAKDSGIETKNTEEEQFIMKDDV